MANQLKPEKRRMILALLTEGNSVRGTSRLTGASPVTIIKLIRDVGKRCEQELNSRLLNLRSDRIECDEIHSNLHTKRHRLPPELRDSIWGDQYIYIALDSDTKLIACYMVGKRTGMTTKMFLDQLENRVVTRFQLSTDQYQSYPANLSRTLKKRISYGQIVKSYSTETRRTGSRDWYRPSQIISIKRQPKFGNPNYRHISTSFIERQNLTIRMECRRLARLTNAYSKKLDCHLAAIAIHVFKYNFIRPHMSLNKETPAMRANLCDRPLTWDVVLV